MQYGFSRFDSSTPGGASASWSARIVGLMGWLALAAIGAVFLVSLLIWMVVMLIFSLVASLLTGRPPAMALWWQRYRDMTRRHWPGAPSSGAGSSTPRADAASNTGASVPTGVQDVRWREVPADGASREG